MNQAKGASMHSELELTGERKYAMPESVPCIVIVGGGFAGLAAARALKKAGTGAEVDAAICRTRTQLAAHGIPAHRSDVRACCLA